MLATPEKRGEIREILGSIPNEVIENEELDIDFTAAQRLVQLMCENGELDQVALLELAKARKYAAAVTALATLCAAPVDIIKQMLDDGRNEPLLVPCKARLSWPTLRALLQDDLLGRAASEDELNKLKSNYANCGLDCQTAARVLVRAPKNTLATAISASGHKQTCAVHYLMSAKCQ